MTAEPLPSRARTPRVATPRAATGPTADVVLAGGPDTPALRAADALGLRVVRTSDPVTTLSLVACLAQPAVVLVWPPVGPIVDALARLRRERPALRLVVCHVRAERPPSDVDEVLPPGLPDDEVVGRIVIHLAHARASAPRRLPVADGTVLDVEARALRRRGRLIHLRPVESRLLEELARSPGRPLGRDWLMARAWPSPPPTGSRTVDVHVRWLRQKLEPDPHRPVHLLTVRGIGYQLEPDPPPDDRAPVGTAG